MSESNKNPTEVTISNRTILRIILFIVGTGVILRFFDLIRHPLTLILISVFLALALNPAVSWIAKKLKRSGRLIATAIAYLLVLLILVTFFSFVIPPVVKQGVDFVGTVPDTINSFQTQDSAVARFVRKYKIDEQLADVSDDFKSSYPDVREPVLSTASKVGNTIISTIVVLIMAFMMLVEGPKWINKFWAVQTPSHRKRSKKLGLEMYRVVTNYVNGQLFLAIIAGFFAFIALTIASTALNISINTVALAGIIMFFALVPMIGNILGAALVVLVCLFNSLPLAIIMALYFIIYQQIENATLQPYIQSRSNHLTPLLVFVAAILGVSFGGLLGGLIAIPVAGCLKIIADDYIEQRTAKP